ncbi:hypothetical protein MGYG_05883 [Nannizzia gypsea CBS 118893]|uniref:Uncharacterized protein n=1 Tax=Arthroderma gypseum (strain ATCC MYA-4604 / CBS 118893) TaxID=535722 RepID=E4UZU5_ARTGP|nr:hypothetical protein MGYG_05883 [Nannizzia gypsea CBS 118893]EFR02882.1 hypothetical protein MGYG_05883 [Nannizzia gypsea CBS 118893]
MASIFPAEAAGLRILAAQYFQAVEVQRLRFPPGSTLLRPQVQRWINQNMFCEATVWPLPPLNYRSRVLKIILSKIEESFTDPEEDEILDDLMASWGILISRPKPSPLEQTQQLSYIKYTPPMVLDTRHEEGIITLENRGLILVAGTTGFRTWEAALHLGTFLSTRAGKELVSGRNVLELGAGTGLVSMYCLKCLGASKVMATDRDPALIANIQECISWNKLDSKQITASIWEWGTPLQHSDNAKDNGRCFPVDTAFGADLLYDVDLIPLFLSTLEDLFDNYCLKEFILSATLRNQETFNAFLNACRASNLQACQVTFESPPEEAQDGFFHSTSTPILIYKPTAINLTNFHIKTLYE